MIKLDTRELEAKTDLVSKIRCNCKVVDDEVVITAKLTPEQYQALKSLPDHIYTYIEESTLLENDIMDLREKFL
jgi:hypothetical protein